LTERLISTLRDIGQIASHSRNVEPELKNMLESRALRKLHS